MTAYYNEFDAQKAAWLRELMRAGAITEGEWMSGQYTMFNPETFADSPAATSSPGSACGITPSPAPDGPGRSGPEAAPARVSAPPAKAKGLMTLVTSGLIGSGSSASAGLQQCLESRLMQRLDTAGSTLFRLTWRRKNTPLGRRYLERAASAPRTGDSGFGLWPTPQSHDDRMRGNTEAENHSYPHDLPNMAETASWPTPNAGPQNENDSTWEERREKLKAEHRNGNGFGMNLGQASTLTAWTSPSARDWKDSPGMATEATNPDGSERTRLDQLPRQANLAAWPTCAASDGNGGKGPREGMSPTGKMPDGTKATVDLSAAAKMLGRMADADGRDESDGGLQRSGQRGLQPQDGGTFQLALADEQHGDGRRPATGDDGGELGASAELSGQPGVVRGSSPLNGFWRAADWLLCRDGRWRPVEPGTFPLAHGTAGRVGLLRGYGDAINAEVAQAFIESVSEVLA